MKTSPHLTQDQKTEALNLFGTHLSCNKIAKCLGFSRTTVWRFLTASGCDTTKSTGRSVSLQCKNCGDPFRVKSCRVKNPNPQFCSTKCYYEFIREVEHKPWRHGQRIARAILEPIITSLLGPNQPFVSHHKDGDDRNTTHSNLMAFPDQENHLAFHRGHHIACVLIDMANFTPKPKLLYPKI